MKKLAIYVHGIGGNAGEAEHYRPLLSGFGYDVVGFDYRAQNPWEAREEFPPFLESEKSGFDSILLIANSIGAYFAMSSLSALHIDRALFISPVADMEKLICDMMNRANVTGRSRPNSAKRCHGITVAVCALIRSNGAFRAAFYTASTTI